MARSFEDLEKEVLGKKRRTFEDIEREVLGQEHPLTYNLGDKFLEAGLVGKKKEKEPGLEWTPPEKASLFAKTPAYEVHYKAPHIRTKEQPPITLAGEIKKAGVETLRDIGSSLKPYAPQNILETTLGKPADFLGNMIENTAGVITDTGDPTDLDRVRATMLLGLMGWQAAQIPRMIKSGLQYRQFMKTIEREWQTERISDELAKRMIPLIRLRKPGMSVEEAKRAARTIIDFKMSEAIAQKGGMKKIPIKLLTKIAKHVERLPYPEGLPRKQPPPPSLLTAGEKTVLKRFNTSLEKSIDKVVGKTTAKEFGKRVGEAVYEGIVPKAGGMLHEEVPPTVKKYLAKGVTIAKVDSPIRMTEDTTVKDLAGNKVKLPKGEEYTPYVLSNNKIWLHDGKNLVVDKSQLENLKGKGIELKGYEEATPQVEEVVLGSGRLLEKEETAEYTRIMAKSFVDRTALERDYVLKLDMKMDQSVEYDDPAYNLPGGQDYREVLLEVPPRAGWAEVRAIMVKHLIPNIGTHALPKAPEEIRSILNEFWDRFTPEERELINQAGASYKPIHYSGEPGLLGWHRANIRYTPEGEKVYFVEEMQDIASEKGRYEEAMAFITKSVGSRDNLRELQLKSIIKHAMDEGVDYISWTTGEQQGERWGLKGKVDVITWHRVGMPEKFKIRWTAEYENKIVHQSGKAETSAEMERYLPKETVSRIMEDASRYQTPTGTLTGSDLEIDPKWARDLYDEMIPNTLKKLTKGKTESIEVPLMQRVKVTLEDIASKMPKEVKILTDAGLTPEVSVEEAPPTGDAVQVIAFRDAADGDYYSAEEIESFQTFTTEVKRSAWFVQDYFLTALKQERMFSPQQALKITPEVRIREIGVPMAGGMTPKQEIDAVNKETQDDWDYGLAVRSEWKGVKARIRELEEKGRSEWTPAEMQEWWGLTVLKGELITQLREHVKAHMPLDPEEAEVARMEEVMSHVVHFLDVEAPFKKVGAPETGMWCKNFFSMVMAQKQKGIWYIEQFNKLYAENKITPQEYKDVLFVASQRSLLKKYPNEMRKRLNKVAKLWDKIQQTEEKRLIDMGVITEGWVDRIRRETSEKLIDTKRAIRGAKKGTKRYATLQKQLRDLVGVKEFFEHNDVRYVHIPLRMWLEDLFLDKESPKWKVLSRFFRKRETYDMVELASELVGKGIISETDLDIRRITASYYNKLGRLYALGEIFNAAKKEGLIMPLDPSVIEGNVWVRGPGSKIPELRGYMVKKPFMDYLEHFISHAFYASKYTKMFNDVMSYTKLMQFTNPLFLPGYDVYQGMWAWALRWSITRPISFITMKPIRMAIKSIKEKDAEYWNFLEKGATSKPFAYPREQYMKDVEVALLTKRNEKYVKWIKNKTKIPFDMIYKPLWDMAWSGDQFIRLITYHAFRTDGMTVEEAAQLTALFHGDYAGVPLETRKFLNKFFFTPTFAMAMGKLEVGMLKATGKVLWNTARLKPSSKRDAIMAAGLLAFVGGILARETMQKTLGFTQDAPGVRYVKTIEDPDNPGYQKELVKYVATPDNVLLRLGYRFWDWSDDPEWLGGFWGRVSWTLHPLWRNAIEILMNRGPNFEPVYDDTMKLDKDPELTGIIALYTVKNMIRVWRSVSEWVEPPEKKVEAWNAFRKECGSFWYYFYRPFVMMYIRETKEVRAVQKVKKFQRVFERFLRLKYGKKISQEDLTEIEKRFIEVNEALDDLYETELRGTSTKWRELITGAPKTSEYLERREEIGATFEELHEEAVK